MQRRTESDPIFKILIIAGTNLQLAIRQCLQEAALEILHASSEEKARASIQGFAPDLVIMDFDLPWFKPIKFLADLFRAGESYNVIAVAADPAIETVVKCMQLGVRDFLQYPNETHKMYNLLTQLLADWQKSRTGQAFQEQQRERFGLASIIGESAAMRQVVQVVRKILNRPHVTVLIRGETGTGKEVVARAIHYGRLSSRSSPAANSGKPQLAGGFVEVNCTAIPENLLEAELFGYEKGAFTDAKLSKKGLFELAEGGTLFLDEIGDMSLVLQAKVLKAIEEKCFRRLGGTASIHVNTRIIAGTNADLEQRIADGRFRRDLYYRLNVINIVLPPLRERDGDIVLLARHFLARCAEDYATPARKFTPGAEEFLKNYDWPGNVRELRHVIERVALFCETSEINAKNIQEAFGLNAPPPAVPVRSENRFGIEIPREGLSLKESECRLIEETLRLTKGNKTRASQILGISRPRLSRKIDEYKIAYGTASPEFA